MNNFFDSKETESNYDSDSNDETSNTTNNSNNSNDSSVFIILISNIK